MPPDSIKIVLGIRALIRVANYSYVSGAARQRGRGGKGRTEMRHDTAVARVHERDAEKFETAKR